MANEISISEKQAVFIANGIYRAITQDLPDMIAENALPTNVGAGLFRYNFINKNLSSVLEEGFNFYYIKRGFWTFVVLYDNCSQITFSVMSEKNFSRLQHHLPVKIHYLEALVLKNKNREPLTEQLSLFDIKPERDLDELEELHRKLFHDVDGVIKEHVLVLFDSSYVGVTSCRAVLLTPELEIAVSEDWSQYLKRNVVPNSTVLSSLLEQSEDSLLVELKPEVAEGLDDDILVSQMQKESNDENE